MIKEYVGRIPKPLRWLIVVGVALIFLILLWYYSTRITNAIGHHFYQKEIDAAQTKVQQQLDDAKAQKKELETTLIQLKDAKEAQARAEQARIEAEKIYNDKTKTANEKVVAFKDTLNDIPVHTSTDGITTSALCERAKANNASPDTIAALCSGR